MGGGAVYVCAYCNGEFFVPQYAINYRKTIKYCSTRCYHLATRKYPQIRKCAYCGKDFEVEAKRRNKKFCDIRCANSYKRERERIATVGADGYKHVWFADGSGEKEHRYIIEKQLGRKLNADEVVHHIDGNRANNDLTNLVVMTRGEHSKLHRDQEKAAGKTFFGGGCNADK